MSEAQTGERELQERWADSRWPTPFLSSDAGERVRVIAPGRWNHGPGPDFLGAQILDAEGRARRGNVELHLDARAWLAHGHDGDSAYEPLLLHVVEWTPRDAAPSDPRIPTTTRLPGRSGPAQIVMGVGARPPCGDIIQRAGAAAVEARLMRIARQRFARKARELRSISAPSGPGSPGDRRCLIAAARALGQPHNADLSERAMRQALLSAEAWAAVEPLVERPGWRMGRGALGRPEGLSLILATLLRRWLRDAGTPSAAFERLASLDVRSAAAELRIARKLGRGRAQQLLADAVYPLTGSWSRWLELPSVRYRRTDELRDRLSAGGGEGEPGFEWRHPHSQALLELEHTRCRQWACRICPLAALANG